MLQANGLQLKIRWSVFRRNYLQYKYLGNSNQHGLGKKKPPNPWTHGLGKGLGTHLHHIVEKKGHEVGHADAAFVSRAILWEVGINPYTDVRNLVWAPSWSHTLNYNLDVLQRLLLVRGDKIAIAIVLRDIATDYKAGTKWYKK